MKKWLLSAAILMVFICIICVIMLPTQVEAASLSDLSYEINDGKVTITDCNEDATGELVIPSKIEGYSVVAIGDWAFYNCNKLTSLVIPEGVTSVGSCAIYSLSNLRKLKIPSTLRYLGKQAFSSCVAMEELHIADLSSYLKLDFDDEYSYNSCFGEGSGSALYLDGKKVTNLVIPNGVQEIPNWAFYNCSGITKISFPNSVKTIGECAFASCDKLANVELNNVSALKRGAFAQCDALVSVTLPNCRMDIASGVFSGWGTLKFKVSANNQFYSVDKQGALYNKNKTTLLYIYDSYGTPKTWVIPASVTSIEAGAAITHVLFEGSKEQWSKVKKADNFSYYSVCCDYVEGKDYHVWSVNRVISEATCKTEGKTEYICCDTCKARKTVTYDKLVTHDWSEPIPLSNASKAYLCITCGKVKVEGVVHVENKKDHFHEDTKIEVIVVDETYQEAHKVVSDVLKDHHGYVAYDISAILQDEYVQPDGELEITIAIPDDFNMDTITIAYISDEGELVSIPCTVDKEKRLARFTTDHFSYYAMTTEAPCEVHTYDSECDPDCNVCGQVRETSHKYTAKWSYDENNHWHECTVCQNKKEEEMHIPGAAATATSDQVCVVCGKVIAPATGSPITTIVITILATACVFMAGILVFMKVKKKS